MPAEITLLCLDVDGVMTDGGIMLDDNGIETKRFHVRDGAGMRMWLKLGYELAIITGRSGKVVQHRARELGVQHVLQGCKDKAAALRELLEQLNLEPRQAAMLGDDLPDLPALRVAGYPMAVADASLEVRQCARFITTKPGGYGAVREAIENLLSSKGRWADAVALFDA